LNESSIEEISSIVSSNKLEFYSLSDEVVELIKEVLVLEPHTIDT